MSEIDIPFEQRNDCFYCGDIRSGYVEVPEPQLASVCDLIRIPVCDECEDICRKSINKSIEESVGIVKEELKRRLTQHLRIGAAWTEEELQEAELSGSALGGFKESAWNVFTEARNRIKYAGWEVVVDGSSLEEAVEKNFEFEGISFRTFAQLTAYVADIYQFDVGYFREVLNLYELRKIDAAVTYCNLSNARTDKEKMQSLDELREAKLERQELAAKRDKRGNHL